MYMSNRTYEYKTMQKLWNQESVILFRDAVAILIYDMEYFECVCLRRVRQGNVAETFNTDVWHDISEISHIYFEEGL